MFIGSIIKAAVISVSANVDLTAALTWLCQRISRMFNSSTGLLPTRKPWQHAKSLCIILQHTALNILCAKSVWKDDASWLYIIRLTMSTGSSHPKWGHSVITVHLMLLFICQVCWRLMTWITFFLSFSCCLPADAGHALCLRCAVQEESWPSIWAAGHHQQLCMKANKAFRKSKEHHRICPQ